MCWQKKNRGVFPCTTRCMVEWFSVYYGTHTIIANSLAYSLRSGALESIIALQLPFTRPYNEKSSDGNRSLLGTAAVDKE
jgi:hypothetical protein